MMTEIDAPAPPELAALHDRYAVYRCYSDTGQLLYIGSTGGSGRRFLDHSQKVWFLQVRGITFEWYADELDARNAERRAIHVEHPKFNVVHRKARRLQGPKRRKQAQPPRPRVSGAETEARALEILKAAPGISGSELGRRLGRTPRYGCILKAKLTGVSAAPIEVAS
jgi:hypothetical protein